MYKHMLNTTDIRRLSDGAAIPTYPGNADYWAVLQWVAAGNVIQAAETAQETADRQAREADTAQREADRQTLVQIVSALSASIQAHTNTPDVSGTAAQRLDKLEARTLATEQRITRLERIARHYLKGL